MAIDKATASFIALLTLVCPVCNTGYAAGPPLRTSDRTTYESCIATAETDPDRAIEEALRWEQRGGGNGARHCAAVAFARRGDHAAAAKRLEDLAWSLPESAPQKVRAELLAQAGNAWIRARKHDSALAVLAAAVDLAPNDATIHVDYAVALAAVSRNQDAIIQLSAALVTDPNSIEALVLRARTYRALGRLDAARKDADRALFLSPHDPQGRLERGIIRDMSGDAAGAASDWQDIIDHHPNAPETYAAKRRLAERPKSPTPGSPAAAMRR